MGSAAARVRSSTRWLDLGPPLTFVRHIVNPVQVSVSSVVLVLREFDDIDVIVKRNASHVIRVFDNDDLL